MCLIVLIQESKGGGLAAGFSNLNTMGGVRKTNDFVEKRSNGSVLENAPVQTTAPALPNPTQKADAAAPAAAAPAAKAPAAEAPAAAN